MAARAFFLTKGVLSRADARSIVRELYGEPDRPTLIALYALALGVEPYMPERMRDADFLSVIDSAIESGQLVFSDQWAAERSRNSAQNEDSAATRLAAAIMDGHDEIVFEGQRYRLAAESTASPWESGEGYQLVAVEQAADVVERMAQKIPKTPEERTRWSEAVLMVRDPSVGRGLSLLRYAPGGGGAVDESDDDDDDPFTPSQLKPNIATEHWIEIAIVYDDGTPYAGNCKVALPDGRNTDGAPSAGVVRVDGMTAAGTCKLQMPDLDGDAFKLG
jgi:hypothetical protein